MKKTIHTILILFTLLIADNFLFAQAPSFRIEKTDEPILIDGMLDEKFWKKAQPASNFQMNYPHDTLPAHSKTVVKMTYDDKSLYVGAICYHQKDIEYVAQTLKRDFSFGVNDVFAIIIDPFNDGSNGQSFAVNPYGVQREGIVSSGGIKGVTTSWDAKWYAEVTHGSGYWSLEMSIPFKTLRFESQAKSWKVNFARNDLSINEVSTWAPVPRGFNIATLTYTGEMKWDESPTPKKGIKTALSPYVSLGLSRDNENDERVKFMPNAGLDAKFDLTSSLNLDVTINPDFSQVEVDEQVLNLDRFEISFPERRFFFTENSDMFAGLGNSRVRPFFSRRIGGVGTDPVTILGGLKLSGKINQNWKIGFLDVQTKKEEDVDDAQNFLVASVARRVLSNSQIKAFVMNKSAFNGSEPNDYNRGTGIEFDYRSKRSAISSLSYLHYATTEEKLRRAYAYGSKIRYRTTKLNLFLGLDAVGKNYITEMGFVPRLYHDDNNGDAQRIGYNQLRTNGNYWFFLKNSDKIDYMGPFFGFDLFTGDKWGYQEHISELGFEMAQLNSNTFRATYTESNPVLFYNFTLSGLDNAFSPGNYHQNAFSLEYETGKQKKLNGSAEIGIGKKYLGKEFKIDTEVNYRPSKWGSFGFTFTNKNLYDFPEEYGSANLFLIGTKAEISFTRNIFWTTFLQYNTQRTNFNINTRFQWRIAPMSDLYFVVTNNYLTEPFENRNWNVVIKANYWFDL